MFIKKLDINKFRLFENKQIILGKYITAIAGFNATGKSTLLGLLGHCGQLMKPKPLLHSYFRADLSQIIKFSDKHDERISNVATLYFEDLPMANHEYPEILSYRSTWQKDKGTRRYRIIPRKTENRKTEKKLSWPTLYLGLGRLYPVGESVQVNKTSLSKRLNKEDKCFILESMKEILNIEDEPDSFTAMAIAETNKKKAIGVNTSKYDYLCNSAGQDNLGQIIIAVLSFKKLKTEINSSWNGGLLLIDELDATLHPLAQNKLVEFLYKQAKEVGFQVVFTTHSLSLLEYICGKTSHNKDNEINSYNLTYVSTANNDVSVLQNPPFDAIYKDLTAVYYGIDRTQRKVSVFSEDEEARYFIKELLGKFLYKINILEAPMGSESMLSLLASDYKNFRHYIFILDGDVSDSILEKYYKKISPQKPSCIVRLPGNFRPEQLLWEYISNLESDHVFFNNSFYTGFTKRNINEHGPLSNKYNGYSKERDKYKRWFNDNPELIKHVFPFWVQDNNTEINVFVNNFFRAYNDIAKISFLPLIAK